MRTARLFAVLFAVILCAAGAAWSQNYPVKPVRVVVPFPPAGANDITARVVLPKLSEQMGQSFIIDNRSGAGGTTGTAIVAKSPADGYTLLIQTVGSHVSNAHLYSRLPYDALRDFTGITPLTKLVAVLTVHPSMPVRSVKEFITLAQKRPKQVLLGHAGYGSFIHLNSVIFEAMTRVQVTEVPFKGGGPAVVGLISGETQAMVAGIGDIIEHIKAGRARPLGVTSTERVTLLPNVPPIADTIPGFECTTWVSIFAPGATPKPIIDQLNSEIGTALRDATVASKLSNVTYDPVHKTPEELNQRVKADYELVGKLFRQFNVRLD
ncbi:MAG TPA: tripartite tricarboxylate transporter substrate-binding protein [Burkholderiales bacterium]|nr:tripartite tricarboxylate transporter substrate-binding protein [Burkholderiales bacterium]